MTTTPLRRLLCAAALALYAPLLAAQEPPADESPEGVLPLQDLRVFADVFNQIRVSYVEEIDDRTLLENAIKGMLNGLDPHSTYLDETSFGDLRENTSGEFGGLGLEVGMDNGFIRVIAPIDDTPAQSAGVEAGDLIISLDGQSVKGMTLNEAITMMRGEQGTTIDLTIIRDGSPAPIEMTLTRDTIRVRSVRQRVIEPGYGYVRIAQFQIGTGEDLRGAVQRLIDENGGPLQGLILDLRNNPGGVLQSSVEVADAFLEQGRIVSTAGRVDQAESAHYASSGDLLDGAPMIVLINGGSASASEIVAGALQDHKRAVILGTDSFGKGSVQTVLPLSQDRAIKLTTARYYTPLGHSIQAQGIRPDVYVERARVESLRSARRLSEADLSGHLSNGDEESDAADEAGPRPTSDLFGRDNQLFEALSVLRGIAVYRSAAGSG